MLRGIGGFVRMKTGYSLMRCSTIRRCAKKFWTPQSTGPCEIMPIKPENAKRYPPNWDELRAAVLERAGHKCEQCGVRNYALGGRTKDGQWLPAWPLGEKMLRLEWPTPGMRSWCGTRSRSEVLRIIKIVLTIAHLDHDELETTDISRLRAWCQKCHLAYDHEHHMKNARATRHNRKALGDLFA